MGDAPRHAGVNVKAIANVLTGLERAETTKSG
jgi:hypothetical protein